MDAGMPLRRRLGSRNEEGFGQRDGQGQKVRKVEFADHMGAEGKAQFQMQRGQFVGLCFHVFSTGSYPWRTCPHARVVQTAGILTKVSLGRVGGGERVGVGGGVPTSVGVGTARGAGRAGGLEGPAGGAGTGAHYKL